MTGFGLTFGDFYFRVEESEFFGLWDQEARVPGSGVRGNLTFQNCFWSSEGRLDDCCDYFEGREGMEAVG